MKNNKMNSNYSQLEESLNILSHGAGLLAAIVATVFLVLRAAQTGQALYIVSFSIFGAGLVMLYSASTIYHKTKDEKARSRLRVFDHAAIYVLIAGTYTPFTLVTLKGAVGWWIFGITWTLALVGIIIKIFFTGRFKVLSTLMYVFMGWIIVFVFKPLLQNFPTPGLMWLAAGGLAYTLGAVLYSIKIIPLNHALFHLLVLIGSGCHVAAVYFYV